MYTLDVKSMQTGKMAIRYRSALEHTYQTVNKELIINHTHTLTVLNKQTHTHTLID